MEIPIAAAKDIPLQGGSLTGQILLIFILTLINAFLSASEMAIISVNKVKLEHDADDGDKKAKNLLNLLEDQSKLLSVIKVGITLVSFFNAASAASGITLRLYDFLDGFNLPYSHTIAQVLITAVLTFITIVFGELVPKRFALAKSDEIARFSVGPIKAVNLIFKPFVYLLTATTSLVLNIFGLKATDLEAKITISDIKSMVQLGQSQGVIDPIEGDMINSVISFDETYAEEIMTPRTEVFMIDINDDFHKYKEDMLSLKYSRIPVYDEDIDNVIGILYLKDFLLESYVSGFDNVDIRKIIKPAYFVPERKNINELFSELQLNNKHMALLIDEYGGFAGLVTMEDLIEEIVGDIDDEYDYDEPELTQLNDDVYKVKASISIKEFNNKTGTTLDEESDDYDTIGGLIIFLLGYIPEDGDTPYTETGNVSIQVLEVKDKRIQEAEITVYNEFTHIKDEGEENES